MSLRTFLQKKASKNHLNINNKTLLPAGKRVRVPPGFFFSFFFLKIYHVISCPAAQLEPCSASAAGAHSNRKMKNHKNSLETAQMAERISLFLSRIIQK